MNPPLLLLIIVIGQFQVPYAIILLTFILPMWTKAQITTNFTKYKQLKHLLKILQ